MKNLFRNIEGRLIENSGEKYFIKSGRNSKSPNCHIEFLKRKIKQFEQKKKNEGLCESEEIYLIYLKENLLEESKKL